MKKPLVTTSAICLDVLLYLIWITESKLYHIQQPIQVNTMTSADVSHGRISAFFMIILITASLFTEANKDALGLEMCEFGRTKSMLSVNLLSAMREFVFWDG